jgi:hypothetical protein
MEYFGEVTAPVLRDNFDIVHQLLEETLDASGHPLTTAPNVLRDIVLPPSPISKILSVAGVAGRSGVWTDNEKSQSIFRPDPMGHGAKPAFHTTAMISTLISSRSWTQS